MSRRIGVNHLAPLPGSPGFDQGVKIDGVATNPVDPVRAKSFENAAR